MQLKRATLPAAAAGNGSGGRAEGVLSFHLPAPPRVLPVPPAESAPAISAGAGVISAGAGAISAETGAISAGAGAISERSAVAPVEQDAARRGRDRTAAERTAGRTVSATAVDPREIKVVHLVQSNHLDVGFSDYVSQVMNRYLTGGWGTGQPPAPRWMPTYYDSFLLNAANTSRLLRAKGGAARYVYTQNSWVLHLFFHCDARRFPRVAPADALRCPTASERAQLLEALRRGDTAMHAFPTSAQAELFDSATFAAGLRLGTRLLSELGLDAQVAAPTVMQQRDVPGITRAVVPLLAQAGVVGLSIGANDGSPAPLVPSTAACVGGAHVVRTPFRWRDAASNTSVLVDLHPGGYGGVLPINPQQGVPYFSRDGVLCDCVGVRGLDHAMCYAWRGDNYGPAGVNETEQTFSVFGAAFPHAQIVASTLDAFYAELAPLADRLPEITSEIGDTWMYGVASDPLKLAQFRAMMRARTRCMASRACAAAEAHLDSFTHLLHKLGEHTWGGSYAGHMNVRSRPPARMRMCMLHVDVHGNVPHTWAGSYAHMNVRSCPPARMRMCMCMWK